MKQKHWVMLGSIMILLWIGLILYFSSQPSKESNAQSEEALTVYESLNAVFDFSDSAFFNKIETFVFEDILDGKYKTANAKVRKSAHFGIYFVLGGLAAFFGWAYTKKWLIAGILGVCLPTTVAVIDEFNQGLIDRTSLLNDVVLDGVGATFGMLFCLVILMGYRMAMKTRNVYKK